MEDMDIFAAEQYRTLYTRLEHISLKNSYKTFAITSAIKGEGKTITSLNLAYVMAHDFNKKVIVVECDLKKPSIPSYFMEPDNNYGLINVINGEIDLKTAIIQVENVGFYLLTASPNTTLEQAEEFLHEHRIEKLPLVDETGRLHGLITAKDIMNKVENPLATKDRHGRLLIGAAIGVATDLKERAEALVEAGVDIFCLDSAHGHSAGVIKAIAQLKKRYPDISLIAGNVCTADGSNALKEAGADAVKVGVGPGSICTTRVITGCGMPQLTAILDANEGVQGKIPIIADGGIRYSGDIVKAIAAGASTVLIGSLFAGTEEAPGEEQSKDGKRHKVYRGMGSIEAMKKSGGDRYAQEGQESGKFVAEGIEGLIPVRGPVKDVIFQMLGGLRSGMGYLGAKNIEALRASRFVRVTSAGVRESHPHDVFITREAPNYQSGGNN